MSEPVVLPTTVVTVRSLPCPDCGRTRIVWMEHQAYLRLEKGESPSEVLPGHTRDDWEAFITGMCPRCWEKLRGPDD